MYEIIFSKLAKKHLETIRLNTKLLERLKEIIKDISINPYSPAFRFERLKHHKDGRMSKRLTDKDRVQYRVVDKKVEIQQIDIIALLGHYDDK